jgi:hypothetical protein
MFVFIQWDTKDLLWGVERIFLEKNILIQSILDLILMLLHLLRGL